MKKPLCRSMPGRIVRFYVEGFRSMTLGRTLWAIVLLKLFIMFAVLRLFFFPDLLAGKSGEQRASCVLEELTEQSRGTTTDCAVSARRIFDRHLPR